MRKQTPGSCSIRWSTTPIPDQQGHFCTPIRTQLNSKAAGKVLFLARDRMAALEHERALKQSGQVTSSSDPNVVEFRARTIP